MPEPLDDGALIVIDKALDDPERPRWFRSPTRPVPRELRPRRDEVVVLHTGSGLRPLRWGERPRPDDPAWIEAQSVTMLRRSSRSRLEVKVPSNSPDLNFTVTVEWASRVTNPTAYLQAADQRPMGLFADTLERIVRDVAVQHDPRDLEKFERGLFAELTAWVTIERTVVAGLEVELARVEARLPDPAIEDIEGARLVSWGWDRDRLTHDVERRKRQLADDDETEDVERRLRRLEDAQQQRLRETQYSHRHTLESLLGEQTQATISHESRRREEALERELATERSNAKRASFEADVRKLAELHELPHGVEAAAVIDGGISSARVVDEKFNEISRLEDRLFELLRLLDPTNGDFDHIAAARRLIRQEIAHIRSLQDRTAGAMPAVAEPGEDDPAAPIGALPRDPLAPDEPGSEPSGNVAEPDPRAPIDVEEASPEVSSEPVSESEPDLEPEPSSAHDDGDGGDGRTHGAEAADADGAAARDADTVLSRSDGAERADDQGS